MSKVCGLSPWNHTVDLVFRLKGLNREAARIRNKMDDVKNYRVDPETNERIYLVRFQRSKEYVASQQDWYKYYERELGDVTKLASLVVQSS